MLKQLDVLIGFVVVMSIVSLLVTIITQMVSSLLGLRGKNLSDALQVMIRRIDPTIGSDMAQQLAGEVLTRPVISDSMLSMSKKIWDKVPVLSWFRQRSKTASAIRADELHALIKDIAAGAGPLKATANNVLSALAKPDKATSDAIAAVQNQLNTLAGKDLAQAKALVQQVASATDAAFINLEKWFNSAQDRAQQWFAMHARVITIIASFCAAFVLQLDTFALLKRISSDSDVRSKLVAGADAVQKQADQVLHGTQQDIVNRAMHKEVMEKLRAQYPKLDAKLDDHADFPSVAEAEKWLRDQIRDNAQIDEIAANYRQLVTLKKLGASQELLEKVASDYQKTGLQLLPDPYPISFNKEWPATGWLGWLHLVTTDGTWSWPLHRLLGILVSAALLSLGAPFWFNTLKSLTSLRPMLANEVDKDPKQIPQTPAK
jgi:hypothetical protein